MLYRNVVDKKKRPLLWNDCLYYQANQVDSLITVKVSNYLKCVYFWMVHLRLKVNPNQHLNIIPFMYIPTIILKNKLLLMLFQMLLNNIISWIRCISWELERVCGVFHTYCNQCTSWSYFSIKIALGIFGILTCRKNRFHFLYSLPSLTH